MTQPSVVTQYPELSIAFSNFTTALNNLAAAAENAGVADSSDITEVFGNAGILIESILGCVFL